MGSRLLQYHNVVGCVFGGEWEDPDLRDSAEIDSYFMEHFGQRTIQTDIALTEKYRYVPKFETGGTFGVNMHTADDRLLSFNYSSIYAGEAERLKLHADFVLDHYLKQLRHLEEAILGRHRADLDRLEQNVVTRIARHVSLEALTRIGPHGSDFRSPFNPPPFDSPPFEPSGNPRI